MAKTKHYVDNNKLLAELIAYQKSIRKAKREGLEKPRVPEYVGECLLKIAEHLSFRPNFYNYSYIGDMIGDGIENCLLYIDNFNPEKSKNPFAYFTQIIWYAFIRRILKEKKQLYLKYKSIEKSPEFSEYFNQAHDIGVYKNTYVEFLKKNMVEIISEFEDKKKNKKKKSVNLEKFFGGVVDG